MGSAFLQGRDGPRDHEQQRGERAFHRDLREQTEGWEDRRARPGGGRGDRPRVREVAGGRPYLFALRIRAANSSTYSCTPFMTLSPCAAAALPASPPL